MSDENEAINVDDVVIEDAANDDGVDVNDLDAAEDVVDKAAANVDVSKVKEMTTSVRNELEAINEEMAVGKMENCINGVPLPTFIFQRFVNRLDPIEYCQNVLRDHYPEEKRSLHSNQIEFIRAACNPKVRRTAALMARQCLIKGTMIHSRDGGVLCIEDHPAAWQTMENAPVLEIHAHGGHVVTCTENHPVFTPDGWRAAADLRVGDKIVCMYAWAKWSKRYAHVLPDTCELMGMLSVVTHVSMPNEKTVRVVCNSRAVMTRLCKLLTATDHTVVTRYQGRGKGVLLIMVDDIMTKWLDTFGRPGHVNVNLVGELAREQTCAYLRGVYNMGASVATITKKYRTYNADVNLGVNDVHAALVRELLLKLGVRARVRMSCGKWYIVRFKGERNRRMFLDQIGPLIGRKFPKCDDVKEMKLLTGDDGEQLYVSRITSIKSAGTADVYDVEYPGKGWFIAGGIKVHNSGKTESVASICGYLCDNYPQMRVGVFTPRLQQAETDIGRTSLFYQMNENLLNNQIVSLNKDKVELSNKSYAMAVSASDQSNIEGYTFDVIILDEAQKVSNYTWSERITPMGGACVCGDSLVSLTNGMQVRIDKLVHDNCVGCLLPCINVDTGKLESKPVLAVHDVGEREVMRITLSSGRTVEGTYGHPVIAYARSTRKWNWIRLEEINPREHRVAVAGELPFFGTKHEEKARLLGMLVGDGSYGYGSVTFCGPDDELWNYVESLTDVNMTRQYVTKNGQNYRAGVLLGQWQLVINAGIAEQTGLNKRFPVDWQQYDAWSLAEFIAGLYDTDGNVRLEDGRKPDITYSSICYELVVTLQHALQKFGILGNLQHRNAKYKTMPDGKTSLSKEYWVLHVRGKENTERFYKFIKLLVVNKQQTLYECFEAVSTRKHKIPRNLLSTDLRFERVVKVEKTGVKNVYDLTVADHHSFVANGVFVHNTNAKLIKVGTPKTRNHFYDCVEGRASAEWMVFRRDWTQCPQLWALDATMLPDRETGELRPYSTFVLAQMPKALKEWYFPNNPEVWTEGSMDIIDFRTQYMLEFVDGAGTYLSKDQVDSLNKGEFDWLEKGVIGEKYVAGIDFAGSNPDGDNTHITVLRVNPDGSKHKVFAKEFADTPYPQQMYEIARLFGGYTPVFQVSKIFADYTGCGAAVVQTLRDEYGLTMIEGIIFNQTDRYTHSGMNMKNIMYAKFLQALDAGKFAYPTLERFTASELPSAGKMNTGFYHKMIGEWADLEVITGYTVNKKIQAPKGYHDDVCDADVLANFTTVAGAQSKMPRPAFARVRW